MNDKWQYVQFEQLFDWCAKSKIGSRKGISNGKYRLYIASATEIKTYDDYIGEGEAIIFGTGGKPCIHIVDGKYSYTNHTECAKKKNETINTKFYYYYFQKNKFEQLQSTFVGSGIKNSSKNKIGKLKVPVVEFEEQKMIVNKIDELFSELDSGIETLQKTKEQLKVYRQAVLADAFGRVKESPILTIDEVCDNIVDCLHSTPKWVNDGELCLRTTNFKRGYLDLSKKNYVTKETFDLRNTRIVPKEGDVLYSREGSILGIACIIPKGLKVCMGQRMMLFRTSNKLNNKYLMYYLNSPIVTNHVIVTKGGTGSPHINVRDIKQFDIAIPNISIQEKIVADVEEKMSVCDDIEKTVDEALQQAESMRQSILKTAFEGRLVKC